MNTAWVIGSGTMYGSWSAGFLAEIGRQLDPSCIDSLYASSVGVYAGTFLVAGQANIIESTWRNHVDGRKLIDRRKFWNPLKLKYLENIFQSSSSRLDLDAVFSSRIKLIYVLTEMPDARAVYCSPCRDTIFRFMSASAAVPLLHPAIQIGNSRFVDGAFSDPLPVARALEDGAERVIVISNRWAKHRPEKSLYILGLACKLAAHPVATLLLEYGKRLKEAEQALRDPRVIVMRPSRPIPLRNALDTDWNRLNESINLGVADARRAINML